MTIHTTINTLRHAHTQYNAEKRYAGSIDVPISEIGAEDARRAAQQLIRTKFDIVITSTLQRTIQTAQILVGDSAQIIQNKLCDERNFGIMEGLTWNDIQILQPPILMVNVGNDLHTVNPKDGEPFEDVWDRAKEFRHLLFETHKGSNILVVSHGVFLQMFHGVLRNSNCIESLGIYPNNLELNRFEFNEAKLVREENIKLLTNNPAQW